MLHAYDNKRLKREKKPCNLLIHGILSCEVSLKAMKKGQEKSMLVATKESAMTFEDYNELKKTQFGRQWSLRNIAFTSKKSSQKIMTLE